VISRKLALTAAIGCTLACAASVRAEDSPLAHGLVLATSRFSKASGLPPSSELTVLTFERGAWRSTSVQDPASQVFHKALVWPGLGLVTLGGMRAEVALWKPAPTGLVRAQTLWSATFGGAFDRMRDGELGDIDATGELALAVGTHDQGVVALYRHTGERAGASELDRAANTWVHEIELGDLDGDGTLEIYATPSAPNARGGALQRGVVTRYVPNRGEGRRVVADFGERHAKEILVADVDGDGRDELYAAIEPFGPGGVEVRRYDAGTDPRAGTLVASLPDAMCRFLVSGDVEGDGRRELVLAPRDSGLWLARPPANPRSPWHLERFATDSASFEHAALLADLDRDGASELYVANDRRKQITRYRWRGGAAQRDVIHNVPGEAGVLTWNISAAPLAYLR
jgi:hypothetical protein